MFPSETEEGIGVESFTIQVNDDLNWLHKSFGCFFGDCYWYRKFKPEALAEPRSPGPKNRRQNDPNISDRWSTLKYYGLLTVQQLGDPTHVYPRTQSHGLTWTLHVLVGLWESFG